MHQKFVKKLLRTRLVNPKGVCSWQETAAQYLVADYFLMPSAYEPCGLCQQECQRYGTVPIVRRTGGPADTVAEHHTAAFPSPNGYVFDEMDRDSLLAAVRRAVRDFGDRTRRDQFIRNTLLQQNGWHTRLAEYEQLYGITHAVTRD